MVASIDVIINICYRVPKTKSHQHEILQSLTTIHYNGTWALVCQ